MNNILKAAVRIHSLKSILNSVKKVVTINNYALQQRQLARNLWYMCSSRSDQFTEIARKLESASNKCSCGCGKHGAHTKAEKELVEFLTEEIVSERKAQKSRTIPSELDGFKATLDGAEVTLTKTIDNETIQITFNVNNSVDTDAEPQINPQMNEADIGALKSKPAFRVDLKRGDTTVSLLCSFVDATEQDDTYNDIFGIDEISIFNGEWNENAYSVSGDVIDTYLYDLLMNYLEEKGISNEFVEKLGGYSTAYEHSAYISLLEGLSKFVSGK